MAAPGRQGIAPLFAVPARGIWGRVDPRARLLATLTVSAVLLAAPRWPEFATGLAALLALHGAARTAPGAALAALRPFRFLLLFTLVVQTCFTPGEPLWPGILPGFVTVAGAQAAAAALLRLSGVIAASALLVATTSPLELARSLGWAIAPSARLGVPVREVTLVMALGFHFFPVLLDESRQVRAALESRGISLRHRALRLRARALLVWTLAVLFGMVERSARLATALEARGFALPRAPRHRFPPWRASSTVFVAASLALAACALALR
ncbi:MAG TPA: energy-coupling factor transporter transmembrane component T [Candidatus Methanoperedens sp.]|nr:energy-coupling factor transporter transmembrane component T [Candidatus Methanoperedens sp.]